MQLRPKVLVIDDSSFVRLEIRQALSSYGTEIVELECAEDLFRIPGRYQDVDLILLDLTLPGIDGLTALEKMRSEHWPQIPVIVLTARGDRGTVQRAVQAGAVNFVRKPFTAGDLLFRIDEALSSWRSQQGGLSDEVKSQLHREIKRAERSTTPVSFLMMPLTITQGRYRSPHELVALQQQVQHLLREIDTVIASPTQLIVILPFTNAAGAGVVLEKITHLFQQQGFSGYCLAKATYPDDGANLDQLVQCLFGKLEK